MSAIESRGMNSLRSRFDNLNGIQKGAIVVAAGALALFGMREASHAIHNARHPEITVASDHKDVAKLRGLLEGSKTSAYDNQGPNGTRSSKDLMAAVIRFQIDHNIVDNKVGTIREGDDTWDALEKDKAGDTPEGLPSECYEFEDAICVIQDKDTVSADIHIMHDGKQKFEITDAGVGKKGTRTDDGSFEVNPNRMYEADYFSNSYHGTPMPFAMFYHGGEALHFSRMKAEKGDNYPGSGGCVTIGNIDEAQDLFHYTEQVLHDDRAMHVIVESE